MNCFFAASIISSLKFLSFGRVLTSQSIKMPHSSSLKVITFDASPSHFRIISLSLSLCLSLFLSLFLSLSVSLCLALSFSLSFSFSLSLSFYYGFIKKEIQSTLFLECYQKSNIRKLPLLIVQEIYYAEYTLELL